MKNYWKNKRVLVTGGTGFIGMHVANLLAEKGAYVTVTTSQHIYIKNKQYQSKTLSPNISVQKVDLSNLYNCLQVTKNKEIVFHFAALDSGAKFKHDHPADMFRSNIEMTINILEACKENNIQRLLLMSSIDIYPKSASSPLREKYGYKQEIAHNITGYAWAKIVSEIGGILYSKQYNLRVAIIRAGNIYGPGDSLASEKSRVIPRFIIQALQNNDIHIAGDGLQVRSFLYVKDFAKAALDAVELYAKGEAINISSANYISIKDLAEMIIRQTGSKSNIILDQVDAISSPDRKVSNTNAKKYLKFKELTSFTVGLNNTIKYIKEYYDK